MRGGQPRRKVFSGRDRRVLAALGDPQRRFPSVLIAGTNGKGSTAATLASILTASGIRTGLYTSPHLIRVNERICLDGKLIGDEEFAELFFKVDEAARRLAMEGQLPQMPSFFEVLTAQAFLYFAQAGVEFAVLEVGMGGRLDATNIVDPLLSIITDISLDHTEWLGSTIAAIAREKAGILRPGGTLITLSQPDAEADRVLAETSAEMRVRRVDASRYLGGRGRDDCNGSSGGYSVEALGSGICVNSPLQGDHQRRNVALAIAAAVELAAGHGLGISAESIAKGIQQTRWPGRLEHVWRDGVEWILDVAHNPAGALALHEALKGTLKRERARTLVFSCLRDKAVTEMGEMLFRSLSGWWWCLCIPRGRPR